ncbi:MAG: prepilin-type N-terminal cleavage/methylation domain-containing protein [Fibrobacterota bacterium]|nr:prepilin-type N-terminal cleavage/methylation domain-containing protein [Fibrobacterota bacterium]
MIQAKKIKNQKGFTLVEVIVVAIIVAALAAVAVPMYTSYVDSSRINAAANAAGSVASFMGACINQRGAAEGTGLEEDTDTGGDKNVNVECKNKDAKVISSMQLPAGIVFKISKLDTNGVISAKHADSDSILTYNY